MLNFGVIGVQGFGRTSLDLLRQRSDAVVTAVCDVNAEGARRLAGERGIGHVFTDYREMLSSGTVDAVVIATPHFLHHPMTMAALGAGLHVFCEKPLAITAADAREMADAAEAAGRVLSCNYSKRQSFPVRALRAAVAKGVLGDCYHANARWHARRTGFMFDTATTWRTDPAKSGGGIFIGRGSHLIDALLFVLGMPEVAAVHAVMQNRLTGFAVEDFAQATLRLRSGASLHVECSYVLPTPLWREKVEYELFCAKGSALYSQQDSEPHRFRVGTFDTADGTWNDLTESLNNAIPPTPSPLDSFVDAVLGHGTPPPGVTAESAAYVSRVLAAGYESARSGRDVALT